MTFQISSIVRCCSHGGMTEAHGKASRGRPIPPFETRQNTKVSWSCAMVPASVKFAGIGLKAKANMPRPFRLSPWQKWQFWKKICPPSRTYCKYWGAFSSHGLPSMYFFWTTSEYFPSSSTRYGLLAVCRTKVLPCTLVLAGGAGCTVRSSIGSSMLGFMLSIDEPIEDRKSTRLNSSHVSISYAVFCLKKKMKLYLAYINLTQLST